MNKELLTLALKAKADEVIPPVNDMVYLFVYGSLRKGMGRHKILERSDVEFVDTLFLPNYTLLDLGEYPTVIKSKNNARGVVGELYTLPFSLLLEIDILEDVPNLFFRELVPDTKNVFIYAMQMHTAYAQRTKPIVWIYAGDYVEYLNPKKNVQSTEDVAEDQEEAT